MNRQKIYTDRRLRTTGVDETLSVEIRSCYESSDAVVETTQTKGR